MRQKNCQKIIIAIFDKLKNTNLITNYNKILEALGDTYSTNIPKELMIYAYFTYKTCSGNTFYSYVKTDITNIK